VVTKLPHNVFTRIVLPLSKLQAVSGFLDILFLLYT